MAQALEVGGYLPRHGEAFRQARADRRCGAQVQPTSLSHPLVVSRTEGGTSDGADAQTIKASLKDNGRLACGQGHRKRRP
jgi:hypothetical protein